MVTRYFLEIDGTTVKAHLMASRQDWDGVEIPTVLREVDATTYQAVVDESTANEDGTYTPPEA